MAEEEESQILESADDENSDEELSARDTEAGEDRSPISTLEALFAIVLCLSVDLLEIFFNVADFIVSIADWAVGILFVILFALKGGWSGRWLKKWIGQHIAEQVPFISMLPIRTAVMIWIIWAWNHEIDIKVQRGVDRTEQWLIKTANVVEKYLGRFG